MWQLEADLAKEKGKPWITRRIEFDTAEVWSSSSAVVTSKCLRVESVHMDET